MLVMVGGKPRNLKISRGDQELSEENQFQRPSLFKDKNKAAEACLEDDCECRPKKDSRTSNIAIKAAQDAKEAQEAQQIAGAQASHQVKAQLAEKAEQAAKAAEAALSGKLVLVDQLEHEVREAEAVVQEEASSCQRTQMNLQISLVAASQAAQLLKSLTYALQISQSSLANTQRMAEGAQQELAEKAALLDAAKCRVEALLKELCVARQDLAAINQAACKAQTAARNASCCAQRNRRRLNRSNRALTGSLGVLTELCRSPSTTVISMKLCGEQHLDKVSLSNGMLKKFSEINDLVE